MGLSTRGYLAPSVGSGGGGGGGGPSDVFGIFKLVSTTTGLGVPGIDLSGAGVIQVMSNNGTFANALTSGATSKGNGVYTYTFDVAEVLLGRSFVKVILAGYDDQCVEVDIDLSMTAAVAALQASFASQFSTLDGDIISGLAAAISTIDAHTDTKVDAAVTTIDGTIASAITTIDGHTDTKVDAAVATIDGHTDTKVDAAVTAIDAHTDTATTAINAHTDSIAAAIQAALAELAGLHRKNSILDGGSGFPAIRYNIRRLMTNARLRVFATKEARAAATLGAADNADGEIARYILSGTDTGSGLDASFSMDKVFP